MAQLGVIKKHDDLRAVWPHEAHDFSKWLALEENLAKLSDEIGIEITLPEVESSVGSFHADLFAKEEGTGRKIIIENQLEDTNHDHLGKIITYASGKGAEVVIWIVKRAREEHRKAIEWLNDHTDENIGFFLVEIEIWQIDNSPFAPKFNVVERPNDWAKAMKIGNGLSATDKLKLDFWMAFAEYAFEQPAFSSAFSKRKAQAQHWYSLRLGTSRYHLDLTVNTQKNLIGAEIYIPDDKQVFDLFKASRTEIEAIIGKKMEWIEAKKACRMLVNASGSIKAGEAAWRPLFDWYIDMALKLRGIASTYG